MLQSLILVALHVLLVPLLLLLCHLRMILLLEFAGWHELGETCMGNELTMLVNYCEGDYTVVGVYLLHDNTHHVTSWSIGYYVLISSFFCCLLLLVIINDFSLEGTRHYKRVVSILTLLNHVVFSFLRQFISDLLFKFRYQYCSDHVLDGIETVIFIGLA